METILIMEEEWLAEKENPAEWPDGLQSTTPHVEHTAFLLNFGHAF